MHSDLKPEMNLHLLLLLALLTEGAVAASFLRSSTTTLGTFNAALLPAYRGRFINGGDPAIEARAELLIEEVQQCMFNS